MKKNTFTTSWPEEVILLRQNAKWLNCEVWELIFCHLNIEPTCNYHHFKLLVSFLGSKTKILQPLLYFSENIQRGDPWKKKFSFLFNTVFYYGISKETIRMPFRGLTMLKSPKLIIKGGLCYGFAMVIGC